MKSRRIAALHLVFISFLSIGNAAMIAQAPVGSGTMRLHVDTREVVLDVIVTDKQGHFVTGLMRDDFTVLEDKVKQRILSFQAPAMHTIPPDAPEVRSTADLQKIGNAPVTILVLDELNTQFSDMAYARGSLQKWLEAQPAKLAQPAILLVASDEKFSVLHDFSQDRAELLASLKQHFPSYPFKMSKGGTIGPDAGERMAISLGTLTQIAQASSGTLGRKNIVWVGVGFPQLLLNDVSGTKEEEITKAAMRTTDAMLKARVTLNVIDPAAMSDSSLDLNNPDYLSLDALHSTLGPTSASVSGYLNFDTFAPATGGRLFAGRNDVGAEIDQAVTNGANFYTLSYSPTNRGDEAAKFRSISIVMKDLNLKATTRTGYFTEPTTEPGAAPVPPTTHDLTFDLTSAALSSITYDGIQSIAQKSGEGYVIQARLGDLKPHTLSNGSSVAEVTVMWVCFAAKNRVLSHDVAELVSPVADQTAPSTRISFKLNKTDMPKGTLRMRLVIRDAISGHIGTIDLPNP
jgi:VWFA-related protein